jgi:hypothetical protein
LLAGEVANQGEEGRRHRVADALRGRHSRIDLEAVTTGLSKRQRTEELDIGKSGTEPSAPRE